MYVCVLLIKSFNDWVSRKPCTVFHPGGNGFAGHSSARFIPLSMTVSARAQSAISFSINCVFDCISMWTEGDYPPCQAVLAVVEEVLCQPLGKVSL